MFNTTAKKWRELNLDLAKNSNVRDFASINELTVLSNLESHNAELIKDGKSKEERFEILNEIAKYQLNILSKNPYIFKVNGKLVRIRFLENSDLTAEDCLTNVFKNLYR